MSLQQQIILLQAAIDALIDIEKIVGGPVIAPVLSQLNRRVASRAEEIESEYYKQLRQAEDIDNARRREDYDAGYTLDIDYHWPESRT